jgi:hypothetical protein
MTKKTNLATAILSLCATMSVHADECAMRGAEAYTEEAIRQLDMNWSKAFWTGDTAFLECLYAPNFQSADSQGKLHSKADDIASARQNVGKTWKPNTAYRRVILMSPHTAIATSFKGDDSHGFRATDFYEYDGKQWHAIFAQDTKY